MIRIRFSIFVAFILGLILQVNQISSTLVVNRNSNRYGWDFPPEINTFSVIDGIRKEEELSGVVKCGRPAVNPDVDITEQKLILNGENAVPNSYPWMVSLRIFKEPNKFSGHFCGASIISSSYILTAAHCVANFRPEQLAVAVGLHRLSEPLTRDNTYFVSEIIVNRNYNPQLISNDIALIRLKRRITYSSKVMPVCLPTSDPSPVYNQRVVITGWGSITGSTKPGSLPNELQQAVVTIINQMPVCFRVPIYSYYRNYCILDSRNDANACFGDSGGPLVWYNGNKWILYGVTSFGSGDEQGNCVPTNPGFYTNVPFYRRWIKTNSNV